MFIFLNTFFVLEGYLKSTSTSSIRPDFIIFSPSRVLESILDFSSMISNTLAAANLALLTDGAYEIAIPLPSAATNKI